MGYNAPANSTRKGRVIEPGVKTARATSAIMAREIANENSSDPTEKFQAI
jgi:hypothetical protein